MADFPVNVAGRELAGYTHGMAAVAHANAAKRRWKTLALTTGISADAAALRADSDGELMTLSGTLPMDLCSGTRYEVPVCVWIPREYPDRAPVVYVLPMDAAGSLPQTPSVVSVDGRCELQYCRAWVPGSSIAEMLAAMVDAFSCDTALAARVRELTESDSAEQPQASAPPPSTLEAQLPPGWDKMVTEDGRTYYVDHATKSSHWQLPSDAPDGGVAVSAVERGGGATALDFAPQYQGAQPLVRPIVVPGLLVPDGLPDEINPRYLDERDEVLAEPEPEPELDWTASIVDVVVVQGAAGLLGRGSLGEVRRGTYKGVDVALKGLHMMRDDPESVAAMGGVLSPAERANVRQDFWRECDTMRRLVHQNILTFLCVVVDDTVRAEPLYMAMQLIESGTLHDLIYHSKHAAMRTDDGHLPLETQLVVFDGIFSGLEYLAEQGVIHRDIKPANILAVVERGSTQLSKVLLADFGESKQLTLTMTRVVGTAAGTPLYQAPEMGEEEEAKGPKADVFSAGIVMLEVNTGRQPNPGPAKRRQGRQRVDVPEEERRADDLAAVRHQEVAELAARCVVDDEALRADAAEIVRRIVHLGGRKTTARATTLCVHNLVDRSRLSLSANTAMTLVQVKSLIAEQTGLAVARQALIFCGHRLDDNRTVDECNLLDGTVLHLLQV